jgi:iron complex transport system substrate-binding protein
VRVVSFLPSATEIVAALGRLDDIVGVSHECDFPPVVRSRDVVTSSAIDSRAAPGDIDVQVRDFVDTGRPLYDVREDRVRALAPDVMVTQVVCDVCAVSEDDVRSLAARLSPRPEVVTLGATTLDGIFDDIRRVALALGVADRADELVERSRARMRVVHETLKAARAPRPRVAVIEWTDPIFAAGHWVPEMVYRAGGADALAHLASIRRRARWIRCVTRTRRHARRSVRLRPRGAAADAERILATDDWAWARDRRVWALDANAFWPPRPARDRWNRVIGASPPSDTLRRAGIGDSASGDVRDEPRLTPQLLRGPDPHGDEHEKYGESSPELNRREHVRELRPEERSEEQTDGNDERRAHVEIARPVVLPRSERADRQEQCAQRRSRRRQLRHARDVEQRRHADHPAANPEQAGQDARADPD